MYTLGASQQGGAAAHIQFAENVIQQQSGFFAHFIFDQLDFAQLHAEHCGAGLPLAAESTQLLAAKKHRQIIPVGAVGSVQALPVLGTAIVGLFGLAASATGWNERTARRAGRNVRVIHIHPANHAGYYPGASTLHLKLVVDADTDAILGAQAIGKEGADKRIDVIATAMRAGLKATDLADLELAYSPQYGSAKDPINLAGMVDDNLAQGEKSVQWHELEDDAQLIDVRTAGEYERGHIPGAVNIPVDELRENIDKLDTTRPVIVSCQVGLRGHVAARILSGYGIDVANLDGGYLTYTHGQSARAYAHVE